MDLTEAEDIKKRWWEYSEELYKKDLQDPDNHDGVRQVLSSYDGDLRDPLWWPQERPVPMQVARGPCRIEFKLMDLKAAWIHYPNSSV